MKAIAAIVLVGLVALVARSTAAPRTAAIGFDHLLHDRDVNVSGADPIACAHCHTVQAGRIVGKPGHAACFGACHGGPPIAPARGAKLVLDADRTRVCTNCHAEVELIAPYAGKLAVPYPPFAIDADFALLFGHRSHRDYDCLRCHDDPARARAATKPPAAEPHRRCASCHDGATGHGPAMSACATCHARASGRPRPPALADALITVTSAFSHGRHAGRSTAGKTCTTCHAPMRDTDETQLPRPTAATCAIAGCHDGAAAFGITVACTRCHRDPPVGTYRVARPTARFSHHDHAAALSSLPCASCHPLGARGEIQIAGHAACTQCHAEQFGSTAPTICGACHTATEPWRPLTADQRPVERTEFGATIDHARHATALASLRPRDPPGGACTSCHTLTTATQQLRPPRGHAACTGTGCHAVASGPAPQLTACASCHQAGSELAREASRAAAVWSVRAAFDHRAHRTTPDGHDLACAGCHVDVSTHGAAGVPTPAKATCAPCHDGATAFGLTGTTCTRCHVTVARTADAPAH